MHPTQTGNGTR